MTLLDLVRGPGLFWSTLIMTGGLVWRLSGILLLPRRRDLVAPRSNWLGQAWGALRMIVRRMLPHAAFWPRIEVGTGLSYVFHIGLLIILLGGAPHILLVKAATGLAWPPLPKGIVALASGITLAALIGCFVRRVGHPVLRLLSNVDDYLSLVLTFLPVLTGILLAEETFGDYTMLLAIHILSVELFMIWLPFGKLAHVVTVFLGRAALGVKFAVKGASP